MFPSTAVLVANAAESSQFGEAIRIAFTADPTFELYVETGSVRRIQKSWPAGTTLHG
jgi:hypothetical protein